MIPNPTTVLLLFFGASTFILIMLLPALLELKKPKDAGPRKIMEENIIPSQRFKPFEATFLANLEKEISKPNQTIIKRVADIIAFLPNLET